jgi:hypothetical protein
MRSWSEAGRNPDGIAKTDMRDVASVLESIFTVRSNGPIHHPEGARKPGTGTTPALRSLEYREGRAGRRLEVNDPIA